VDPLRALRAEWKARRSADPGDEVARHAPMNVRERFQREAHTISTQRAALQPASRRTAGAVA